MGCLPVLIVLVAVNAAAAAFGWSPRVKLAVFVVGILAAAAVVGARRDREQ